MILTIISPPGPVRPYTVAGPRQLSSWITVKELGSASASVSRLRSEMKGGTPSEIFLLRVAPIMARYGWSLLPLDSVEPTDIFLPRPGEGEGPDCPGSLETTFFYHPSLGLARQRSCHFTGSLGSKIKTKTLEQFSVHDSYFFSTERSDLRLGQNLSTTAGI